MGTKSTPTAPPKTRAQKTNTEGETVRVSLVEYALHERRARRQLDVELLADREELANVDHAIAILVNVLDDLHNANDTHMTLDESNKLICEQPFVMVSPQGNFMFSQKESHIEPN